ncbi:MAG: DHH family phosphoesterase, partial [Planctomycetes bacterium]|nr:DHH family phosphoesterase [Planctomycetota bacterium]
MNKTWVFTAQPEERVASFAKELRVSPVLARLLLNRGIEGIPEARAFLNPSLATLPSPHAFAGMDKAIARIRQAIAAGEEISIFGDYDADGTCGSAILVRLFRMLGANFSCHLPSRNGDGYGLSINAIDAAKERGVGVLITVDNGIAAVDEVRHAEKLGIDVIVTDHHRFGADLPPALALLHPGVPGSTYPHPNLCGAGVAFKLALALAEEVGETLTTSVEFQHYVSFCLAMVAIASIADVVPLVGENRALVKAGLAALGASNHPA